jgi:putative DNA primase/helicase
MSLIRSQEPILWLKDAIMREYTFATMDDNDDIYHYNNNGIFVNGGSIIIKKQIELLYPNATTYKVYEITNHIRRSTFVSRSDFDHNIDVTNTDNCVLNLHTLEVKPHSPDYLSLVKIPVKYNPDAKCPLILEFFSQVLRPEDILLSYK